MTLAFMFLARPTRGADEIKLQEVAVGFNDKYKVGVWTPVSVTLSGPAVRGRLELHTADGDDVDSIVAYENVQVDERQPKQMLVRFGSSDPTLTIVFRPEGARPLRWELHGAPSENLNARGRGRHIPEALQSTQELLVEIGRSLGLRGLHDTKGGASAESTAVVQLDTAAQLQQLPTEWIGYEGVDALFLGTSQELDLDEGRLLSKLGADNARWKALAQWVRNGGRLIVAGGGRADQLANVLRKMGPVSELMPGRLDQDVPLDRAEKLDEYVAIVGQSNRAEPLQLPLANPADPSSVRRLTVPHLVDIVGAVEVAQDNVPLVVRVPRGFGEVVFVALDLDRPPVSRWSGRTPLLNKLLRKPPEGTQPRGDSGESAATGQLLHAGVNDLAGQLKGALDQFTGISPVSFVLVAGLALLYIALIGPLDYVLVRKVFRRPKLTWITFPLMVVVFSAATYQIAYWMKGKQLLVNQVDLVDVELSTGQVRGQTWFNVFSPDGRAYNVSVRPHLAESGGNQSADTAEAPLAADGMRTVVAWLGLPGNALGGMERTGTQGLFQGSYQFTPQSDAQKETPRPLTMEGVPIQVWSSKSFTARWTKAADAPAPPVDCDLHRSGERLRGTIRNRMDVALKNCVLVFRPTASGALNSAQIIPITELKPGQTWPISAATSPDDLAAHVKGFRYVEDSKSSDNLSYRSKDYDPLGTDVPSILKQMSFYRLIKGREHTHLLHRYQGHVDLSHLLEPKLLHKRAILIGFAATPAAEIRLNDRIEEERPHDQHWTCYRFVAEIAEN